MPKRLTSNCPTDNYVFGIACVFTSLWMFQIGNPYYWGFVCMAIAALNFYIDAKLKQINNNKSS